VAIDCLANEKAEGRSFIWVVDRSGEIVGYLRAVLEEGDFGSFARIAEFWVQDEDAWSEATEALFKAATASFEEMGVSRLDGWALPGDRKTKGLFESAGFKAAVLLMSRPMEAGGR
jgi:N-acetylglutamate synthase-like GNAT family acetyltransferase